MKRISVLITLLMLITCGIAFSQDTLKCSADFQAGADIMSRYIWRGLNLGGTGPSIQPTLKLIAGKGDHSFSVGGWGAYTFSATANQEVDLFASYTYKGMLTVMITDYFFPELNTGVKDEYFNYGKDSTGHVFEGMVMFNGTEKIPFTLMIATNFYGNDSRKFSSDGDSVFTEDGIQYSTYIEIGYKKRIKTFDFNAFVGGTINNPDEAMNETGYYGNTQAGLTNVGIKVAKNIPITDKYSLPVQALMIANPLQNKFYLVFGITI